MAYGKQGLVPVRMRDGRPYSGAVEACILPASDGTATFIGDAVKSAGDSSGGVRTIAQIASGDTILGVVVGFIPDYSNLALLHRSASTLRTALVCTDPDVVFQTRVSASLTSSDIGLNGDIVVGSGSTVTGKSGMELDTDGSPALGTASAQLRILGVSQVIDNSIGTNCLVDVMINEHELKGTTGV